MSARSKCLDRKRPNRQLEGSVSEENEEVQVICYNRLSIWSIKDRLSDPHTGCEMQICEKMDD